MANGYAMITAFVDIHKGDPEKTFNGMLNFVEAHKENLDNDDWKWIMWLAEELKPCCKTIHESFSLVQIDKAVKELSDFCLTSIIYVFAVLEYRGILKSYIQYCRGEY